VGVFLKPVTMVAMDEAVLKEAVEAIEWNRNEQGSPRSENQW